MVDRVLANVQAGSGLVFSVFGVMHLSGHMLANLRYEYASSALYVLRNYYHTPLIEAVLVGGALAVHVASSTMRRAVRQEMQHRRKDVSLSGKADPKDNKADPKDNKAAAIVSLLPHSAESSASKAIRFRAWHRYAGYTLALFMLGHVGATRLVPLLVLPDASIVDLTMVTQTTVTYPGLFHVYYFALGTAGLYHTLYGISAALGTFRIRIPRVAPKVWDRISLAMVMLMASTIMALAGFYEPIFIPRAQLWNDLPSMLLAYLGGSWN
ncbi:hypothetical protein BASA60_009780 [Batrachochytrium salamandrivorans]|nr:hypothetical protein BASA60_009780 [Batrachochytrium salamandrivorans]KAH9250207.1 hypothetical protein BASA81_012015 [Batrachochytrium salamandrivorans]